jgi:hypothetical protein
MVKTCMFIAYTCTYSVYTLYVHVHTLYMDVQPALNNDMVQESAILYRLGSYRDVPLRIALAGW